MLEQREASALSKMARNAILAIYKKAGWTAIGELPEDKRFVLIAAPHTSNWDFIYFLGLCEDLKISTHFMAKESLFRWPWRNFMLDIGGVPINRSAKGNIVDQMVDEFNRRKEFILTIAPEGTRGEVKKWKTGFYQIAMAAKVPIVIGMMNYGNKSGGLGPAIMPTGDFDADMAKIKPFYDSVIPKHPSRMVKNITGNEDI